MTLLLEVNDLAVAFPSQRGEVLAVQGATLHVDRGEIVGLVGESGSGKSMIGFSIMGLLEAPGRVVGGAIRFDGEDLTRLAPRAIRSLRGRRLAMIFQDPMMTLNPVLSIGTQLVEAIAAHRKVSHAAARGMAAEALALVGLPSPIAKLKAYPHQLSGGQRQRIAIAIAMLHQPDLIIADEPTTALDVTVQAQIMREMRELVRRQGSSMIWISHDLAVVAELVDRVCVMYAGEIVEQGPVAQVVGSPAHPYTQSLLASIPSRNPPRRPLPQIDGLPSSPVGRGPGCRFRNRCPKSTSACALASGMREVATAQWARCHYATTRELTT